MGSGESDAHYIKVAAMNTADTINLDTTQITTGSITVGGTTWDSGWYTNPNNWHYYWGYPQTVTVYKYQVKCPARACKTFNWLELDTTTPCTKCGAKLRAVSDKPDFNIPVSK